MSSLGKAPTIGYKYYAGMHLVQCHFAPKMVLKRIIVGERLAWSGTQSTDGTIYINNPELFGGDKQEGGVQGYVDVMMGAPAQGVNAYLQSKLGAVVPAFRHVVSLVLKQVHLASMNPYIKPWSAEWISVYNTWYAAKAEIGADGDMNPAHIIYELITNFVFGMGYPTSVVDSASFTTAADTLYSEGFGLSILWDEPGQSVEDFIAYILKHIDGVLYIEPSTGKFVLKLARDDYVAGTLLELNQSNVLDVERWEPSIPSELKNAVTLQYFDRDSREVSITIHDGAGVELNAGAINLAKVEFSGIATDTLARRVAMRELKALATPLFKLTLTATRVAATLRVGSVFRFTWTDYGVSDMVFRVASIAFGTLADGRVRIDAVQDVFGTPTASYIAPPSSEWVSPYTEPAVAPYRMQMEAPWWTIVREITGESLTAQNELETNGGFLLAGAEVASGDTRSYEIWTRQGGAAYVNKGTGDVTPTGTLTYAVGLTYTSTLYITNPSRLDQIEVGTWAIINPGAANEEIVGVKSVNVPAGTISVDRGVLDTVPVEHAAGERIWFADVYKFLDYAQYLDGESLNVKTLTQTSLGTLAEGSAPQDTLVFDARAYRPFPPQWIYINNLQFYPAEVLGTQQLEVTWYHRDRTQQTVTLTPQQTLHIGPELNTSYNLRLYDENNVLRRTVNLATNSYIWSVEEADCFIDYAGLDAPVSLLHFDGNDGSGTFTDTVSANSWSRNSAARIEIDASKFGTASGFFDGVDDYIYTAHRDEFNFDGDFTIDCWINPDVNTSPRTIAKKGVNTYQSGWLFGVNASGIPYFSMYNDVYAVAQVVATSTVPIGAWTHVAVERAGATLRIYVNGVHEGSHTISISLTTNTLSLYIGRDGVYTDRCWDGYIDEFRMVKKAMYGGVGFTPNAAAYSYLPQYRKNGVLRFELESLRNGLLSWKKHNVTVKRYGYGFQYGNYYGGK